jgi:Tfp pilus assembly protein PilO
VKEATVQIKNRQQLLMVGAIVVIALFAGDHVVLTPLLKAWSARSTRITELHKQIAQGKLLVQRERGIRNQWQQMVSRSLTNNTSAAEQQVVQAIDQCAQNSGVVISAITPQWKHDSDDYATYECRVDAAGDLDKLNRFLYSIERQPLALKLELIELGARDKDGQQLTLGLQLSALALNSPATPTP